MTWSGSNLRVLKKGQLTAADLTLHESEYQRLVVELEESYTAFRLYRIAAESCLERSARDWLAEIDLLYPCKAF